MTEEDKPESKKEERALSILEQIKQEREAVESAINESRAKIEELRELRAVEMLSGKTEAGKQSEKPKEETPKEYADRIMRGGV